VSPVASKTIEYLNQLKVRIVYVPVPLEYTNQLGMLARLYAGALPETIVRSIDYMIISDSDLVPVSKTYFNIYNSSAITALNAYGIGTTERNGKRYDMFAMGYIGMRKWQWREVMSITKNTILDGANIMKHIKMVHGKNGETAFRTNDQVVRGDGYWYLDQNTITIAIYDYLNDEKFKLQRKVDRYHYTGIRLDRADDAAGWYSKMQMFDRVIDSHLYHGDAKEKLKLYTDLSKKMFDKSTCDSLKTYFDEFFKLI
jgi:hypothetical protein